MHNWNRLLPLGGVVIYPDILYKDVNDVLTKERTDTELFFHTYAAYRRRPLFKGNWVPRQYCAYIYKNDKLLGCILSHEILDNPDGYGEEDFEFFKLLYPDYRNTKYARYMTADFLHIMFMSDIAKRLYAYVPSKLTMSKYFFDVMDTHQMPCVGVRFSSDNLEVQKYIKISKTFVVGEQSYAIVEFDGDTYREMDLVNYMSAVPGRNLQILDRWFKDMNDAAQAVKELCA